VKLLATAVLEVEFRQKLEQKVLELKLKIPELLQHPYEEFVLVEMKKLGPAQSAIIDLE